MTPVRHVLRGPAPRAAIRAVAVLKAACDWPRPSDHVPVLLDLDV